MNQSDKPIIGTEEWCAFPELKIPAVKARVDSGAKTSALHAFHIQAVKKDGQQWVRFLVHPLQNNRKTIVQCEAPVVGRRLIKSSSGTTEKRFVISTPISINREQFEVELTLTNRDSMGYRMLLGREALNNRMIVDSALHFNFGERSAEEINIFYGHDNQNQNDLKQDGLRIGILSSDPNSYSNQFLLDKCISRGHEIFAIDTRDCHIELSSENSEVHYSGNQDLSDFDAIIPLLSSEDASYGVALIRHFESLGIFIANSADSIDKAYDDILSLQILQSNELPTPKSVVTKSTDHVIEQLASFGGFPILARLSGQHYSTTEQVISNTQEMNSLLSDDRAAYANLLVQEYFPESEQSTITTLCINKKLSYSFRNNTPSWLAGKNEENSEEQKTIKAIKIDKDEQKLVRQACKVLRLKVAEVEFIRSDKGPVLKKVSPCPLIRKIKTRKDPGDIIIQFIEKNLGWQKQS